MKKTKKGFTLVELLVVVAILAVLATVTTISYFAFTSRAKESNDISLTAQMNTVLQGNEAVDGKAKTMSQALRVLSDAGLDVTKLSPISDGYSYVYDSDSGKMLLLNKDKEIVAPEDAVDTNKNDTFAIVKTEDELSSWLSADYGIYFANGYTGTTELTSLTSIDVGDSNIKTLTVNDEASNDSVLINADLDSLNLNAPNASIDFYGNVTTAEVTTADHSLHIYGHIQQLNVLGGRVVVENNGEVNTIDASNSTSGSVAIENNGTIGAIISDNSEIVSGETTTVVSPSNVINEFSGGTGTKESPYLINSVDEWSLLTKKYTLAGEEISISKKGYYFNVINDLDFSNVTSNYCIYLLGNINFLNHKVYLNGNNAFPSLFYDVYSGSSISNLNYYLPNDLTMDYALVYCADLNSENDIILDSINLYGDIFTSNNNFGFVERTKGYDNSSSLKFINCNNYASITSNSANSAAIFLGKVYEDSSFKKANVIFEKCNNYGTLVHVNGYASMLLGNGCSFVHNDLTNFVTIDCNNYGTIFGTDKNTNLFCGSGWNNITINDIQGWLNENSDNLKNVENGNCAQTSFKDLLLSDNNTNEFDTNNVIRNDSYSYKLSFNFWIDAYNDSNYTDKFTHGSFGFNIGLGNTLDNLYSYNWISESFVKDDSNFQIATIGDEEFKTYEENGNTYFVFEKSFLGKTFLDKYIKLSNCNVSLVVTNSDSKFIDAYTYQYPDISLN